MAEMFQVSELVQVAVDDERTGVVFYTALAGKTRDPELKKTFTDLAEQEKHHQKRFEEMLATIGQHKAPERYGGEYASYLQALTSLRAFPDEASAVRMAGQCADDKAALDLATTFERDTLILMQEMRELVPARDRAIVDELANEERAHIVTLTAAAGKLGG